MAQFFLALRYLSSFVSVIALVYVLLAGDRYILDSAYLPRWSIVPLLVGSAVLTIAGSVFTFSFLLRVVLLPISSIAFLALGVRVARCEWFGLDWLVRHPLVNIRRFWTPNELINFLPTLLGSRDPDLPSPSKIFVEAAAQSATSMESFRNLIAAEIDRLDAPPPPPTSPSEPVLVPPSSYRYDFLGNIVQGVSSFINDHPYIVGGLIIGTTVVVVAVMVYFSTRGPTPVPNPKVPDKVVVAPEDVLLEIDLLKAKVSSMSDTLADIGVRTRENALGNKVYLNLERMRNEPMANPTHPRFVDLETRVKDIEWRNKHIDEAEVVERLEGIERMYKDMYKDIVGGLEAKPPTPCQRFHDTVSTRLADLESVSNKTSVDLGNFQKLHDTVSTRLVDLEWVSDKTSVDLGNFQKLHDTVSTRLADLESVSDKTNMGLFNARKSLEVLETFGVLLPHLEALRTAAEILEKPGAKETFSRLLGVPFPKMAPNFNFLRWSDIRK